MYIHGQLEIKQTLDLSKKKKFLRKDFEAAGQAQRKTVTGARLLPYRHRFLELQACILRSTPVELRV